MLRCVVILALLSLCLAQHNMVKEHSENSDILAEAHCIAQYRGRGWVFAVRRRCGGGETCNNICKKSVYRPPDPQTAAFGTWRCIDALHVFDDPFIPNRQRAINQYSRKVLRFSHCFDTDCGPNYCCCVVDNGVFKS